MPVPGPAALGRSVVISVGDAIPAPWMACPVITVDEAVLADPAAVVERLHRAWAGREPVVVELGVDPARFRDAESILEEPWRLAADAEPFGDRLHFLVWANTYDARGGELVWWWGRKAARVHRDAVETPAGTADLLTGDGTAAWVDGGPRGPWAGGRLGAPVVHAESVEAGSLAVVPEPIAPVADLAADQLAAVAHGSGPARVIAPAGSGKTRVLTERLRHLVVDRGVERELVLAVAYNKQAQMEMEERTTAFGPRVRTLNSLGLWVLGQHRGSPPPVIDEREVRRSVEALIPGKRQRRSNTDPIGPYVEGLSLVRLGLTDPADVAEQRDDVPGLAEVFPRFRAELAERGVVDFDEQIYGAIEALLRDGPFRREMQRGCRHLLVDEFQDLTPAHVLLIRLLSLPALDVFGVGDDDQCIYGHAGADPVFLIDYEKLFPEAAGHPLTVNYRCPAEVVDGARSLLGYNRRRVAEEIVAGPAADGTPGSLTIVEHEPDQGATAAVEVVRGWLADPGVEPSAVALLARVGSLLLAPHVALHEAGIPVSSVLGPEVLERTGMRAALAYLRIGGAPKTIAPRDVIEILRRPTRGLPQWFSERLERRASWTVRQLRGLADQVPEKDGPKVLRLVGDLEAVIGAAAGGSTRLVLEAVRDDIGLGSAMSLLDRTGGGQGSSHLDDLEGLLGVADLHPDPVGFETWLRGAFQREAVVGGVSLSTIHRVKGREWDRVAVFGVSDGVMPHRLADDEEEERRVLHVAVTRARHRVTLLADRSRRSPFLDELTGVAHQRPARAGAPARPSGEVTPRFKAPRRGKAAPPPAGGIEASLGLAVQVLGGYEGTVEEVDGRGARIRLVSGGSLSVRYGERVEADGRKSPLAPPAELWGAAAAAEAALRAWRSTRSKADGVPAYVVASDKHLRGMALARPGDLAALAACEGIGPTKLEKYGEEILEVIGGVQ